MASDIFKILEVGGQTVGLDAFYETIIENDGLGNPIYVGRSPIINPAESADVWYIVKMLYDGNGFVEQVRIPPNGRAFVYSWTNRATYFV